MTALTSDQISSTVRKAFMEVPCIDLHTHLFPPEHGKLMLYGIDELLTYHYLVSEFFMVAPEELSYDMFFEMSKEQQADLIWDALFVKRSPISEAQRGILTTLKSLGLDKEVKDRDLVSIRKWFSKQNPCDYLSLVFKKANVQYAVMTNVPFNDEEASYFRQKKPVPPQLKTALRVDQLLNGDWDTIKAALKRDGYEETLDGLKEFLKEWIGILKPEYFMASTPAKFVYPSKDARINNLLNQVLFPLAVEYSLPLALKVGAERGLNPGLRGGGDGLETVNCDFIKLLCKQNPKVKILITLLSRSNQHEIAILSQKLRNLHLYGCWWYLNNPSIIREMTEMRVELLGTAFTAQHSDARILDQLLYKWNHSRTVICEVLIEAYTKTAATGWNITEDEIYRDVRQLLGGCYEDFIGKSELVDVRN